MGETTNQSYIFKQAMVVLTIGLSGVAAMLTLGYTSPAIPSMFADQDFDVTDEQASWIGSVLPFSALLGSLAGGHLVDAMGRKGTFLLIALPFILSWAMIAVATDVTLVVLGRLLGGACVGVQTVAACVYTGEIVELDLKGTLMAVPGAMSVAALLLSFVMGQYLMWRELAWFGAAVTLAFTLLQLLQPESPLYLLKKADPKAALSVLQSIRRSDKAAQEELEDLKLSCTPNSSDDKESVLDLLVVPNRWPVGISVLLMFFQQTTGINAVIFYAASIFEAAGADLDPGTCSVLLGVVNLAACLINMALLPIVDRTSLLYYSSVVLVPSLGVLGGYFIAKDAGGEWEDLADNFGFVPMVSLLVYMLSFGMGWGPVPWVFMGEGLPSRVRGLGSAATACSNWGGAFLVTKMFGWCVKSLGSGGTFLGFAVCTAVGQMIIGPNMPETRNKSMQEVDQMYEQTSKAKKVD